MADYTNIRVRMESKEKLRMLCDTLDVTYAELFEMLLAGYRDGAVERAHRELQDAKARVGSIIRGEE